MLNHFDGHSRRAHYPYKTCISRVLEPADACHIHAPQGAPVAYEGNDFFPGILFQSSFHLGKNLVIRVMHNGNALLWAIRCTQAASLAEGLYDYWFFILIHLYCAIRAPLPTDATTIAIGEINVGHYPFRLNIAVFHGNWGPHGRPDSLLTSFLKGLRVFCTTGKGNAIGRKIQWAEFYMGLLKKPVWIWWDL